VKSIFIVSLVSLLACASSNVQTDYDRSAAFNTLRTYQWLKQESVVSTMGYEDVDNSSIAQAVKTSADDLLKDKGFRLIENDNSDFLITYYAGLKQRVNVNEYGYSYGEWQSGLYDRNKNVQAYQEGLLMIDIILESSKELIWRGWLTGIVEEPSSAAQKIKNAVKEILDEFPPEN
jgi:hypothetical protein